MKKKMNVKIKRSKNRLYRKRKSTGRKVLEGILLVALIGGLGFLGYSAAGPIINYFKGETQTGTITAWTPDESLISEVNSSFETNAQSEKITTTEEKVGSGIGSYLLPESALENYTTLKSALEKAKNTGCNQVLIPLKTLKGNLLYQSNIEYVKDTDLITATMNAGQIVSAAKSLNLTPRAVIPALYDSTSSFYVENSCYRASDDGFDWLDNYADRGGKRWVDPSSSGAEKFLSDLGKELIQAGFEEVIFSQMRFPAFIDYDKTILDGKYFAADRYKLISALYSKIDAAAGKKTAVEIDIKDVLANYGTDFTSTAELLKDKSFSGTVYLKVTLTDFEEQLQTGENTSITLPADQVKKCTALIERAAKFMGTNITVIPVINPEGISEDMVKKCYEALKAE